MIPPDRASRVRRILTVVMLIFSAIMALWMTLTWAFFVVLFGGMASVAGGGGVSDEQFKFVWLIIMAVAFAPSVVVILFFIGLIFGLRGKYRLMVIVVCALIAAIQLVGYHWMAKQEFTILSVLILMIPMAGIVIAILMKRKTVIEGP